MDREERKRIWWDPSYEDEPMDGCLRRALALFGQPHVLGHERVASDLTDFVLARLAEEPDTPHRPAAVSVVVRAARTAGYLSCGKPAIVAALATLLRFALPYAEHVDYGDDWRPLPYQPGDALERGACACCRGLGYHECGEAGECDSCSGSGRQSGKPGCRIPHGPDCMCTHQ